MAVSVRDALADAIRGHVEAVRAAARFCGYEREWVETVAEEETRERIAALLAQVPQVFEAREDDDGR